MESVAFGGDALARHEGKVYFVADALPGETVELEILQDKERFAKARVLRRIAMPAYAVPAPCPYVENCGGCQWQKVPYAQQLNWKSDFIQDALQRIGGIARDSYPFVMQAAPEPYAYRNRVDVKWQVETDGSVNLGYFAKASHQLVSITRCAIAEDGINEVLEQCRELRFPKRERPFTTSLEFQVAADAVLVSMKEENTGFWRDFVQAALQHPWLKSRLHLQRDFVELETWDGLRFHTRAGQFQQVNLEANRFLRGWVRDRVRQQNIQRAVDLYCGSGNLSLALARDGIEVFGVEAYAPSIEAALHNCKVNRLKAAYAAGDAEDIRQLFPDLGPIDLLIVDPPRRGLEGAIGPVLGLGAQEIIYVSCDPNTLARDLKLMLADGYVLEQVMGLDFFPQGYHVETVCVLQKHKAPVENRG